MKLTIDLQIACEEESVLTIPSVELIQKWVKKALELAEYKPESAELTVRIVGEAESQQLNCDYRQKNKPTNVLSFPFEVPPGVPCDLLGDLVICLAVVEQEAKQQQKPSQSHWAHMLVHGTLHLLGFDHINDNEAEEMESLEIRILNQLNFSNPY